MSRLGELEAFEEAFTYRRLLDSVGADQMRVTVEQVNPDAPMQLRLLCKVSAPWPANFRRAHWISFRRLC